jgi:hypothetical protein
MLLFFTDKAWLKLTNLQIATPIIGVSIGFIIWVVFVMIDFRVGFKRQG